jgi:hypothetical protein
MLIYVHKKYLQLLICLTKEQPNLKHLNQDNPLKNLNYLQANVLNEFGLIEILQNILFLIT